MAEYVKAADSEIMVAVQVETPESVDHIEEIASVPGVDMIFVGPADLSATCGHPLNPAHPDVERRIARTAETAGRHGVALGTVSRTPEEVRHRVEQGFQFLVIAADTGLLLQSARDKLSAIQTVLAADTQLAPRQ